MENIFKIKYFTFLLTLAFSFSSNAWEMDKIELLNPNKEKREHITCLHFFATEAREDEVTDLEVYDDDGIITLACIGRLLQVYAKEKYDAYVEKDPERRLSAELFFDEFGTRSISSTQIDKDPTEACLLKLCFELSKEATERLDEKITRRPHDYLGIKKREKILEFSQNLKTISCDEFSYNFFFETFGAWLKKNIHYPIYMYNTSGTKTVDKPLGKTVNAEDLGLHCNSFKRLQEDDRFPKSMSTLAVDTNSIQISLSFLSK